MEAMQYEITLPADYDLDIIRRRVADNGWRTDDFGGLGVKAYLIAEEPVNLYAPFYLWNDPAGMRRFLWGGGGFERICASFGRPPVRHWSGVAAAAGPSYGDQPVTAIRSTERLPAYVDPAAVATVVAAEVETTVKLPGVHTAAVGIDPFSWEVVRFTLLTSDAGELPGQRYQVLHTSAPELDRLLTRTA